MTRAQQLSAHARVTTTSPERYRKQLASHLGRRSEIRDEASGTRIVLTVGDCLVCVGDGYLDLTANAATQADLEQVTNVVGSHLVRFGQRNELVVEWTNQP
jgi:uncharacterized protein